MNTIAIKKENNSSTMFLTHSRLKLSYYRYSQGLADKISILDEKAKGTWTILVK